MAASGVTYNRSFFVIVLYLYCFHLPSVLGTNDAALRLEFKLNSSSTPLTYTALSGGLTINYSIPAELNFSQARFDLIELDSGRPNSTTTGNVVMTVDLPPIAFGVGEFTLDCGALDAAGLYRVRLEASYPVGSRLPSVVAETRTLTVGWPRLKLVLPNDRGTLDEPVDVTVTLVASGNQDQLRCESQHDGVGYAIQTVYLGRTETKNGVRVLLPRRVVHSETVPAMLELVGRRQWTVPCMAFDQAGVYQSMVVRTLSRDPSSMATLAVSNEMNVTWSSAYSLSANVTSLQPCESGNHLTVHFTQPTCSGHDDKVRVYRRVFQRVGSVMKFDRIYVTEQRTWRQRPPGSSSSLAAEADVRFDCDMFSDYEETGTTRTDGFCFVYVSTANSGAVTEQKSICLPLYNNQQGFLIDGNWSDWSSWSGCSVTCGRGRQSRYRTCDNPPPTSGGQFCVGSLFDWQSCPLLACMDGGLKADEVDASCECGCELFQPAGQLIAPADHRCNGPPSVATRRLPVVWRITAEPHRVVQITYRLLIGGLGNDEVGRLHDNPLVTTTWVRIRDGVDVATANMLAMAYGGGDGVPKVVTSTTRHVHVEYQAPNDVIDGGGGFMASYITLVDNSSIALSHEADKKHINWLSSWHSIITVSGITFGALVGVIVLTFLCYHRVLTGARAPSSARRHQLQPLRKAMIDADRQNASVTYLDDMRDTSTRSYLLAAYRSGTMPDEDRRPRDDANRRKSQQQHPDHRHGPCEGQFAESEIDPFGHCQASYKMYGFPCATYSGPAAVGIADEDLTQERVTYSSVPFNCRQIIYEQPMCHPYHAVACVNCAMRRSQSPTCSGCSGPLSTTVPDKFVEGGMAVYDRPSSEPRIVSMSGPGGPQPARSACSPVTPTAVEGSAVRRPPVDGSDSEMTPAMPRVRTTEKRDGGKASSSSGSRDTGDRPDGQSPSEKNSGLQSLEGSLSSIVRRSNASNGTLSDLTGADNELLEYDDDIPPTLPGSYFNMDPNAYTLTWSKQPQATGLGGDVQSARSNAGPEVKK